MSMEKILKWLKEHKESRFTATQLIYFLKDNRLSESVIYANLKRLRDLKNKGFERNIDWIWGNHLSEKARPARYYFYKEETKWKKLKQLLER